MILTYGSYTHEDSEVRLSIAKQAELTPSGVPYKIRETWDIGGVLHGASVSAVTTAIAALEAAYEKHGQNLILYESNGSTRTAHYLIAADMLTGPTVIRPPSYPNGSGADYTTFRQYQITVEAEYEAGAAQDRLLSWEETIQVNGNGGPRYVVIELRNGPPQRQQVSEATPIAAVQAGRAVGLAGYPLPPAPLWPAFVEQQSLAVSYGHPRATTTPQGTKYTEWPVTWQYNFLSPVPLFGTPRLVQMR